MNRAERIDQFVTELWTWYVRHKRELPWRDMDIADDTERAYRVMVSEIMLQQTQVSRVKIVFKNFLDQFPTLNDLARASNKDVIMAWRGMGYNSRALRLRDAATNVVEQWDGVFPSDYDQLLSISGIGPYTAAAIRNFAFTIPTPCIDTNIRRILHRTFIGPENTDGTWEASDKELLQIAEEVLGIACHPERRRGIDTRNHTSLELVLSKVEGLSVTSIKCDAADWHAALMDYGSLIQTKNNPKWDVCVLTQNGIMKATPKNWKPPIRGAAKERIKKEPGRMEGAHYVPNRIFRGRIVEALRDNHEGLRMEDIGVKICNDWNSVEHKKWLKELINKLVQERMIVEQENRYVLHY